MTKVKDTETWVLFASVFFLDFTYFIVPELIAGAPGGVEYPDGSASFGGNKKGYAYVFKLFGNYSYSTIKTILPESPTIGDLFGSAVGLSNGTYIIGNPRGASPDLVSPGAIPIGSVGN